MGGAKTVTNEVKHPFDGWDVNNDYPAMMSLIIDWETYQANELGRWLLANFNPERVIDVGCGPGNYLIPFKDSGCNIHGVDACPTGGELLAHGEFERVDLRFPYQPEHRFDLAICIEVAEHLERRWSECLVDTLARCSDLIVFTAATPNQGGTCHFNEQPHEFWLDMFRERHGYKIHSLHDNLRAFLEGLPPDHCQGWLKANIFLLVRG